MNPTEAAIRERAQESHAYALMVLGDMFNALHLQAAELERVTAALRDIRNLPSDHDLMHNPIAKAVYTIADAALAGGARAAQEGK
jgi:UDP-2,3-diacylglucosamine pyrophosphatase LpxH